MYEFHSEEALVDTITAENSITADFFLGVDGRDGAGKTTLTRYLAEKIGASVISLDEFIEKNKDAYMSSVRFSDLKRAIAQASGPVIIEGACLLAVLQRVDIRLSQLVYVKRMRDGGWWDEKICDPPDDVESFLAEERKKNQLIVEFEAEFNALKGSAGKDTQLAGLYEDLIRYHRDYRPASKADYVFERYIS